MERKLLDNIALNCPNCQGQDFSFNKEKTYVKCNTCGKDYFGGVKEVFAMNLSSNKEINDFAIRETERTLEKALRGHKNIKFK